MQDSGGSEDPGTQIPGRGAGSKRIQRSRGHRSLGVVSDPDGSDNPEATDPCSGCRIQVDPRIQRPRSVGEGAGSRRLQRSGGHRSLGGVQDSDGAENPEATDPCKGCRIQVDPMIQGPRSMGGGRGSRRIQRSRDPRSLGGVQDPAGSDNPEATDPCKRCRIQADPRIQGPRSLGGVQDPKGSNDPEATDPWEW